MSRNISKYLTGIEKVGSLKKLTSQRVQKNLNLGTLKSLKELDECNFTF